MLFLVICIVIHIKQKIVSNLIIENGTIRAVLIQSVDYQRL